MAKWFGDVIGDCSHPTTVPSKGGIRLDDFVIRRFISLSVHHAWSLIPTTAGHRNDLLELESSHSNR